MSQAQVWQPDTWAKGKGIKSGCVVAVPSLTKGTGEPLWPGTFCLSLIAQSPPINFSFIYYMVNDREVGQARNDAVKFAKEQNAQYILFRDNDVIAPPDAVNKLFVMNVDIAAGVYYSKQWPSHPLIFRFPQLGGYRDWRFGEIIECDAVGMGCTLIKMSVFDKLKEPWFATVQNPGELTGETKKWSAEESVDCDPDHLKGRMTEDIYFCLKAKKAGFKVYANTGVQCTHVDTSTGRRYGYAGDVGDVIMQVDANQAYTYPEVGHPARAPKPPEVNLEVVRFDIGSGGQKRDGYISVDAFTPADERGDCHDLAWLVAKYGKADEIRSSHTLEHFSWRKIGMVVRNWVWALKPGGLLNIITPDLNWVLRNWLDMPNEDPEKYQFWLATIFGLQTHDGEFHRGGFTADLMEKLLSKFDLEDIQVEAKKREEANQGEIFATARKKPEPAGLPVDAGDAVPTESSAG